jgi:putative hydrolase of the HAD superfamily
MSRLRCIAFDAVGTLVTPDPPAPEIYQSIAARYGGTLPVAEIRGRFKIVMSRRPGEERTSELAEREFWRAAVEQVVGPVTGFASCFEELYEHFAQPGSWRLDPEAPYVLRQLRERGIEIAVASNFDERLHRVMNGMPALADVPLRVISSEIGWRKPHPEFFAALLRTIKCGPGETLMVGDDAALDVAPARALGLQALLLAPGQSGLTSPPRPGTIARLSDVLTRCETHD